MQPRGEETPWRGDALFSPCGRYRYSLSRLWEPTGPRAVFIMLNPSTACASRNDPTIRRCIGFARSWGFGALDVGNLFAWKATDPATLREAHDPVGPDNDAALLDMTHRADLIVVAWGTHPAAVHRASYVIENLLPARLHCLGKTQDGAPRHPLYLRASVRPQVYTFRETTSPPTGRRRAI